MNSFVFPDIVMMVCILAGIATTAVSAFALWRGSIHYLPTLGWCFLMVFPFALEYPLMYAATRDLHAFAVLLFLGTIFITDRIADKTIGVMPHEALSQATVRLGYILGAAYIAFTIFHLATVQTIPFVQRVFHGISKDITDEQRNDFSRGYSFIPGLKYVFTFALPLLGMPAILLLWRNKRYISGALLFLWLLAYCVTGTAKGPFILAILIACAGILYLSEGRMRVILSRAFLGIALASIIGATILTTGPAERQTSFSNLTQKYAQPRFLREDHKMMLGDYTRERKDRLKPGNCDGAICNYINYLTYRIILTPIEVSARWYEYFTLYPVETVRYGRMIEDSRTHSTIHPAQAVGLWGFHEPYPHEYFESVYAYPSIDADAWGRYGLPGLALAALLYVFLRLGTIWFHDTQIMTQGIYYAVTIGLFTLLPANSSIQAMLVAHGFIPIMTVMCGMYVYKKYQAFRITKA